jgi:uncharacterized protein YjiS (DUF1127 family)
MTNYLSSCKEITPFDYFRTGNDIDTWMGLPQLISKITFWQQRSKQRSQLKDLESRLLSDIGLTAEQANIEANKPFWVD